mmetsp:Transcript_13770/g.45293  ORF Transcript_13770/g.45293 Transcript_13770/m.45293 type:complete len:325 (+) Transcript_13770:529-1503(+)
MLARRRRLAKSAPSVSSPSSGTSSSLLASPSPTASSTQTCRTASIAIRKDLRRWKADLFPRLGAVAAPAAMNPLAARTASMAEVSFCLPVRDESWEIAVRFTTPRRIVRTATSIDTVLATTDEDFSAAARKMRSVCPPTVSFEIPGSTIRNAASMLSRVSISFSSTCSHRAFSNSSRYAIRSDNCWSRTASANGPWLNSRSSSKRFAYSTSSEGWSSSRAMMISSICSEVLCRKKCRSAVVSSRFAMKPVSTVFAARSISVKSVLRSESILSWSKYTSSPMSSMRILRKSSQSASYEYRYRPYTRLYPSSVIPLWMPTFCWRKW